MYTDGGGFFDEGKYEQLVTTFPNKQESLLKLKVPHCCPQPRGSFLPTGEPEIKRGVSLLHKFSGVEQT